MKLFILGFFAAHLLWAAVWWGWYLYLTRDTDRGAAIRQDFREVRESIRRKGVIR